MGKKSSRDEKRKKKLKAKAAKKAAKVAKREAARPPRPKSSRGPRSLRRGIGGASMSVTTDPEAIARMLASLSGTQFPPEAGEVWTGLDGDDEEVCFVGEINDYWQAMIERDYGVTHPLGQFFCVVQLPDGGHGTGDPLPSLDAAMDAGGTVGAVRFLSPAETFGFNDMDDLPSPDEGRTWSGYDEKGEPASLIGEVNDYWHTVLMEDAGIDYPLGTFFVSHGGCEDTTLSRPFSSLEEAKDHARSVGSVSFKAWNQ